MRCAEKNRMEKSGQNPKGEKHGKLLGRLSQVSLLEVVEPVLKSGACAKLEVSLGNERGSFYFDNGRMVHAESTVVAGQESAYHLISWRNGTFSLQKDVKAPQQTVEIEWINFLRFYEEEIEKIVLEFVPNVDGGLYLEMRNQRGDKVFGSNHLYKRSSADDLGALLSDPAIESAIVELRRGLRNKYAATAGEHVLIIKYLAEIRYCVIAVFIDPSSLERYERWLDETFEPRALEAVSLALEKADKKRVRGVILVIDDSPTTRAIMEDTLTEYRFKVITAEDGYEGLVKMRECKPQLVFLDVMMPKMDGYEVLKRIRGDEEFKSVPVVMLTSKGLVNDRGKAFEKGANLYIEKPFTSKKILTIVENVLGLE